MPPGDSLPVFSARGEGVGSKVGGRGKCERRGVRVIVTMQKKVGRGRSGGGGGQSGCEPRIEVIVKMKKKSRDGAGVRSGGAGRGGGSGRGGGGGQGGCYRRIEAMNMQKRKSDEEA